MKKFIATIICFVLVFAFAGSAMAVGVYQWFDPGDTNYPASGTRTPTTNFRVQMNGNSNFNGNADSAGVNFRAVIGTAKCSNDLTFKIGDLNKYKSSPYTSGTTTSTFRAKENLNISQGNPILFSGNIYF